MSEYKVYFIEGPRDGQVETIRTAPVAVVGPDGSMYGVHRVWTDADATPGRRTYVALFVGFRRAQ